MNKLEYLKPINIVICAMECRVETNGECANVRASLRHHLYFIYIYMYICIQDPGKYHYHSLYHHIINALNKYFAFWNIYIQKKKITNKYIIWKVIKIPLKCLGNIGPRLRNKIKDSRIDMWLL